LTFGVSHSSTI